MTPKQVASTIRQLPIRAQVRSESIAKQDMRDEIADVFDNMNPEITDEQIKQWRSRILNSTRVTENCMGDSVASLDSSKIEQVIKDICEESNKVTARQLSFSALRQANIARLPQFRNNKGTIVHNEDGSDWSAAQWLQAVVGELGEYANFRKKFERGDITLEEFHQQAKKELADVMCYLDILAYQVGVDLGEATREKFNEVSRRVGCNVTL